MSGQYWGPDLIIKCFPDLDTVFFGGLLRGNVTISWGGPGDRFFHEDSLGVTIPIDPSRAEIVLNGKTVLLDPFEDDPFRTMFATTLHEMCVSTIHLFIQCLFTKFSMYADEK